MAVAHVLNHTAGTSKTSDTTVAATLAAASTAGNLLRVTVGFDNTSATAPVVSGISKPGDETASWVKVASHDSSSASSGTGCRGEQWVIQTTVAWANATTVTVTLGATVTAKAVVLSEFSGVTTTVRGTAGTGTSTVGTPSAATSGTALVAGDLVCGGATFEDAATPNADADTTNGSWAGTDTASTIGGIPSANISVIAQHKIVTATGAQTFNPTLNTDSGSTVVALVPSVTNTAPNAPLLASPFGGQVIDRATTLRLDWVFSDPDAGDSQSKYDARYRIVGAGTWTDVTGTTPNTFHDIPGGTLAAGDYEWQVSTYDAQGLVGPYSASEFFTAANDPTGVLSATLPSLTASLTGTYTPPPPASGVLAATLPALTANLTGTYTPAPATGSLAATLPSLTASLTGTYVPEPVTGSLAATLPTLTADLVGTYVPAPVSGALAATLPALTASLTGTYTPAPVTGSLAVTLPALTASLAGTYVPPAPTGINDPRDISGLVAWYSAQAETGYTNGQAMTGLTDLSGNGNHATPVGALSPLWEAATGPAGGPALRFRGTGTGATSGTEGHFQLPNVMSGATSGEILYSLQADSASVNSQLHGFSNEGLDADWYVFNDGKIYDGFGSTARHATAVTPPASVTAWRRYGAWSAPSDWGNTFDGASLSSTATNTVNWVTNPLIGRGLQNGLAAGFTSIVPFKGRVAAVVIFNRKLTTTERADLDAWLVANPSGGTAPATGTLDATLPALTSNLAGTYTAPGAPITGSLAATLPALTASLAGTVGWTNGDLTYADDGYNYNGVARVYYDPPVAEPITPIDPVTGEPVTTGPTIRRTKVRRVHVTMPTPTLVDGRPI